MSRIGIIGCGRIGTRLAQNLAIAGRCLEIQLWNRSEEHLDGALRSLQVWANITETPTTIRQFDWSQFGSLDLIVISIKDDYDPRVLLKNERFPGWFPADLRSVGLRRDLPLLHDVCHRLHAFEGKVAVVTNPVDLVSSLVHASLPAATVFGLGLSVDAARFAYLLPTDTVPASRGDCLFGGEHGRNVVPIRSLWRGLELPQSVVVDCLDRSMRLGAEIVRLRGFTLEDCCATFAEDILWLLGHARVGSARSLSIWQENACVGWPIERLEDGAVRRCGVTAPERQEIAAIREELASVAEMVRREGL